MSNNRYISVIGLVVIDPVLLQVVVGLGHNSFIVVYSQTFSIRSLLIQLFAIPAKNLLEQI